MAADEVAEAGEGRVLGIDRRTIGPALLVLALAVLESLVLPSIDARTEYRNQTRVGDLVQLADGVTLAAAPGWDLESGALVGDTRSSVGSTAGTSLVDGGVSFSVDAAPFDGDASALLTRIEEINADLNDVRERLSATTDRYAVTTRQGVRGVGEDFVGATRQGSVVAFVIPAAGAETAGSQPGNEGLAVVVSGAKGPIARHRDDIVAMIRSIRVAP
jgi:hypothetical protein